MFPYLFLLFTLVPIVELWLLVRLAAATSVWVSIGLVLSTGLLGAALIRWQTRQLWRQAQSKLTTGAMPFNEVTDGLVLIVAGALLVTPGLITDLTGILLLIPPVRAFVKRVVSAYLARHAVMQVQTMRSGNGWSFTNVQSWGMFGGPGMGAGPFGSGASSDPFSAGSQQADNEAPNQNPDIIDVEFTRTNPSAPKLSDQSERSA